MKTLAFIVNPVSGRKKKRDWKSLIARYVDAHQFRWELVETQYKGHATELAAAYAKRGYDAVIAVGGDGTVNEVACGLRDTATALGIVPIGSGNGLALHLGISLHPQRALKALNKAKVRTIDYGMAGDQPFFCTCGVGFDAYISHQFATMSQRGFMSYLQCILHSYRSYPAHTYTLSGDSLTQEIKAFLITVANANQWGNQARVAAKARLDDGLLDVVVLKPFPLWIAPWLAFRLYNGSLRRSHYINYLRATSLRITQSASSAPMHYDGEPSTCGSELSIRLHPRSLHVWR